MWVLEIKLGQFWQQAPLPLELFPWLLVSCSPTWLRTGYVAKNDLELWTFNSPAAASGVLELQACTFMLNNGELLISTYEGRTIIQQAWLVWDIHRESQHALIVPQVSLVQRLHVPMWFRGDILWFQWFDQAASTVDSIADFTVASRQDSYFPGFLGRKKSRCPGCLCGFQVSCSLAGTTVHQHGQMVLTGEVAIKDNWYLALCRKLKMESSGIKNIAQLTYTMP